MAHLCFIIEPKPRQPPRVDEKIVESWPKEDGRAPELSFKMHWDLSICKGTGTHHRKIDLIFCTLFE